MRITETFPVLTKRETETFSLCLADITRVQRPKLVALLTDGSLNNLQVVSIGQISHAPWRSHHAGLALAYHDESTRKRQAGRSQVETIRAWFRRVDIAWTAAFVDPTYPAYAIGFTDAKDGAVDFWRLG